MQSRAIHHYPQFIFEKGEKLLWNPISKKAYKNRPEERIRLKYIEFLLQDIGWSKNRISTEAPLKLPTDKGKSRTDIICYDENFKPYILIECKAENISINESTALQIARYNSELRASFLSLTNGLHDYWFEFADGKTSALNKLPFEQQPNESDQYSNPEYWQTRGFLGNLINKSLKQWLLEHCRDLYLTDIDSENVVFQEFDQVPTELYLPGYYRLVQAENNVSYPICFSSSPTGATYIHIASQGEGILSLLLNEKISESHVILFTSSGLKNISQHIDIRSFFDQPLRERLPFVEELIRSHG